MTTTRTNMPTTRKPHGVKAILVHTKGGSHMRFEIAEDAHDLLDDIGAGALKTLYGPTTNDGVVLIPWDSVDFIQFEVDPDFIAE